VSDADPQEEPLSVRSLIGREAGRWVVYLEFAYPSEVRRHRIADYPTERKAQVAADAMLRTAMRDRPFRSEGH
jgi:hypothetical protein